MTLLRVQQEETLSPTFAGRLIHSWNPWRSPEVTTGISEWITPRPAVIHCTPPAQRAQQTQLG